MPRTVNWLQPVFGITGACLCGLGPARAASDDGTPIVVIASPLSEAGQRVADGADLDQSRATSAAEQLARTAPGVTVNDVSGNPLQPDINYRGFTASPLLGTAQGLSVYVDGVRINQPFGDVVSWDLVPPGAIAQMSLVSGASPQFGRNALGGALTVTTKDGRSDPGVLLQLGRGSFGRVTASAQFGGQSGASGFDWFVLADRFREDGWRDASGSRATRGFAKLGWSSVATRLTLSGSYARSDLTGNGLQEFRLLTADRASVYTTPDTTRNRAGQIVLAGEHKFSGAVRLRGNLFWRRLRTATLNGDVNEEALGQNPYQPTSAERAALAAAGYTGFPLAGENQENTPFPRWRCIANALLNDEPNEKCTGLFNRSASTQDEVGGSMEALVVSDRHSLTLGLNWVHNRADFVQTTQFGYLVADRSVVPVDGPGAFADGTQTSENAFDARVDLHSVATSLGLYALGTVDLGHGLQLDLAARYDRTHLRNRDRITPGGGIGSLDSDPVYARLNPAASLHWQAGGGLRLSASWSQASRAPSAIELGCSDPASPCRLPNALAGDPPLRQVVARTVELRAALERPAWQLGASLFATTSSDDILFVSSTSSGYGYFRNFGQTRRQGLELSGQARRGSVALRASYTLLDASYRSAERVGGAANSTNDAPAPGFDGTIAIQPGDRIPLIPRHTFKLALRWTPSERLTVEADMVAVSGVFARGNENNRHQPDGTFTLGQGRTASYAVANVGAQWRPLADLPRLTVYTELRNVTGAHYATAAQLGATAFDAQGRYVARPFAGPVIDGERPLLSSTFLAPGAPRTVELGLRFAF